MSESILKTGLSRLTSILKLKESEVGELLHEEITRQVKEMVGTPLISEPEHMKEIDAKEISAAIARLTREVLPRFLKRRLCLCLNQPAYPKLPLASLLVT